ncbi:hypothetical protein BV133_1541 [Blastochloris viridis]|uniref:Uncharacterized protein n=1 Tax=Blastochloris viridis TaxID=1079 RepID=A0A182D165_BLAVI|nr:hypothetical protein BV133_1541 [Blastochloris viridis]
MVAAGSDEVQVEAPGRHGNLTADIVPGRRREIEGRARSGCEPVNRLRHARVEAQRGRRRRVCRGSHQHRGEEKRHDGRSHHVYFSDAVTDRPSP